MPVPIYSGNSNLFMPESAKGGWKDIRFSWW